VRKDLERIEIPGEHDARVRSWEVVRAAFAEREPVQRRARLARPVLVLAAVAVLAAAALSPPGQAVIDRVREAIGVEDAKEALFSLPAGGRLLVESADGPWVVQPDGSKRRLGDYREASWSPFGRFVVAARRNELAALEPDGDVRWSLARPGVRTPRWGGTRTDTRIAYLGGDGGLRVVAGDGEGDRAACAGAVAQVAPAWRPVLPHTLAFVASDGVVHAYETDVCRLLWRSPAFAGVRALEWSGDGSLLLVRSIRDLRVLGADGRVRFHLLRPPAAPVLAAAFSPARRSLAFVQQAGGRSSLWLVPALRPDASAARKVFEGAGTFTGLAWSPDGRWLLVTWREADQWVFVRVAGRPRIEAVSRISSQFGGSFPRLAGWCCPP
jgi:WD40-like Beta Propeller Repeat